MSFVSSILNPGQGAGFQAGAAQLQSPVNDKQVQDAYGLNMGSLEGQQQFLAQLRAQGGLQNQSNVFNQQQGLADQLGQQALGQGPNPAQAQLAQNTANNTANQAALMASQRGAGSNPGMIARQAAMQGGANQQQAVGQAATLQAQQQIAAQQALMQQQAQMANLASQQAGQLQTGVQQYVGNTANQYGQLLGATQNQNQNALSQQANINNTNAAMAGINAKKQGDMLSGGLKGAGTVGGLIFGGPAGAAAGGKAADLFAGGGGDKGGAGSTAEGTLFSAHGGMIHQYADGGKVQPSPTPPPSLPGAQSAQDSFKGYSGLDKLKAAMGFADGGQVSGPKSFIGQYLQQGYANRKEGLSNQSGLEDLTSSGGFPQMAHGGKVPAMVSPGERYLPPKEVKKVAKGEESPLHAGKKVPGKAHVKGDSLKNDTVKADLEEGGLVIPRSVMQSKDPEKKAADFVAQVLARQGMRGKHES